MISRAFALFAAVMLASAIEMPRLARAQTANPCAVGYQACGLDYSANAAAVPISGYVLLTTIPASRRASVEVQNQSTDTIQVVRDDGLGNQVTSIMLAPAALVGLQGAAWWSNTFWGRVRVYGPSSADRVGAYQE